ncbi:MAG TPA: LytTR family DNA-binding domain-containing protein [Steroidobacteraceae bacterium]|nr:LytTR family DNA-binding domain-containing protein [Steroidobacteraceae bacterium]
MAIRVLIVDDEPIARRTLEKLCLAEKDLQIVGQCRHGEEAITAIASTRPDLVFLDVEMRNLSGLEVIARIGTEQMPLVIFVTAFDRYAAKAFDVNAVDYLLKPFDEARFKTALARARERLSDGLTPVLRHAIGESLRAAATEVVNGAGRKPLDRVAAEDDGRLVFVEAADIQCIEARGNHIVLHTRERSHLLRATLQQAETLLDHGSLMRIHRGIVINRRFVRELARTPAGEYQFTLANGQKYVSSAGYRQAVLDYLKQSKV